MPLLDIYFAGEMLILERCLYWRDVCIRDLLVYDRESCLCYRAKSVLEDTSISERCLYKRNVYTKEISV